jgi:PEGA domain
MGNFRSVRSFLVVLLAGALLTPSCATLTRKSTQGIPVTSSPAGATIIVNGVQQGVTPLMLVLTRKLRGQVIRIESPGYNPVEIRPERKLSGGAILGNVLLGIIPGTVPVAIYGMAHFFDPFLGEESSDTVGFLIWGLGAAVFGGVFTAVDSGNGCGYSLRPTDLTVTLTKAGGTPRVDTVLVDAEDFQNVKWIRVHKD